MKLSRKYVLLIFKFWKSEIKKIKTEKKANNCNNNNNNKQRGKKKKKKIALSQWNRKRRSEKSFGTFFLAKLTRSHPNHIKKVSFLNVP